jgi:hypothetical protein
MLSSIYFICTYLFQERKKKDFKNTILSWKWILICTTIEEEKISCKWELWSFVVTEWKMQLLQ